MFLMIVTLRHNCSNMSWIEQNVKKLKTKPKINKNSTYKYQTKDGSLFGNDP